MAATPGSWNNAAVRPFTLRSIQEATPLRRRAGGNKHLYQKPFQGLDRLLNGK